MSAWAPMAGGFSRGLRCAKTRGPGGTRTLMYLRAKQAPVLFGYRPKVQQLLKAPAGGFEPPTFSVTGSCPSVWASPDRVPTRGIEPHQPSGTRATTWLTSQRRDRVGTPGRTCTHSVRLKRPVPVSSGARSTGTTGGIRTLNPGLEDLLPVHFGVGGLVRVGGFEPPTPGFEDRRSDSAELHPCVRRMKGSNLRRVGTWPRLSKSLCQPSSRDNSRIRTGVMLLCRQPASHSPKLSSQLDRDSNPVLKVENLPSYPSTIEPWMRRAGISPVAWSR